MYKAQQKAKQEGDPEKPPGTILVFLPGWGDIDQLMKRLVQNFDQNRFKVLPLHSQVTADQQQEIFQPAPEGIRKIVLTTNIAEASITVDGTEFVIDSGRAKEVSYDPFLKVGTLNTSWISQASAKQRAGRAGRTQGGLCFHLFCRERFLGVDYWNPVLVDRSNLKPKVDVDISVVCERKQLDRLGPRSPWSRPASSGSSRHAGGRDWRGELRPVAPCWRYRVSPGADA